MKPIEQTEMIPGGGGNCVAACIASIFELPLEVVYPEVPNGGGWHAVCDWTTAHAPMLSPQSRQFFVPMEPVPGYYVDHPAPMPLDKVEPPVWPRSYWIAYVESPRAAAAGTLDHYGRPTQHAVVMLGHMLAWDPHPQREMGVGLARGMLWWAVKDHAAIVRGTAHDAC
jgi:hypothetical protein